MRPVPAMPVLSMRRALATAVAVLAASAAACGTSADPADWAEADESGTVEANFMLACRLANDPFSEDGMNVDGVEALCRCSFNGLRAELDFDEFKELDAALRVTPDPSDLDDADGETAEENWEGEAERIIEKCLRGV